jgi:ATP-binding cassette subfamily F protein 3
MPLIALAHVAKHFAAQQILDDVSFSIERGDHVALVGANGAGKSTLMRIIAGIDEPDAGSVSRARGARVAYLPQDPDFDDTHTLFETLLDVFSETIEAQERLRLLEGQMAAHTATPDQVDEYGRLQALIERTGYDYHDRIERALTGLGLAQELWYLPVTQLSGGQRTRANLARTLLSDADLLLLDEPTNHLDIPAVEWLERYLHELARAFLIVAHDRYVLDRVTRRTLELSARRITEYDAPYSRYLELRAERSDRQRQEFEAQQHEIAKTEEFIRRYGAGQRAKEARGRQKRLDRLERIERPPDEDTIRLRLSEPQRSGDIVLRARHLAVGYPDNLLIRLPDELIVLRGEKIAIIGPNGSGKTTLLHTLLGTIPLLSGTVRWGTRTSVAYYSQSLAQLDDRRTVLDEIRQVRALGEEEARGHLGRFLFSGDDVFKTVSVLSGGERSRVALAKLILQAPNVLVLDEPTNHLDIASREAFERVLAGFDGTLLFVSHDRFLIDGVAQQLWVVHDRRLSRYAGNYSAYAAGQAHLLESQTPARPPTNSRETPEARTRRLETEAESLATRLGEIGATATLGQLDELSERYGEVLAELMEAQRRWTEGIRTELHAFSASRDRSVAARQP